MLEILRLQGELGGSTDHSNVVQCFPTRGTEYGVDKDLVILGTISD